MQKPTGNSSAPTSGSLVFTVIVTANAAASARMAPAIKARMSVSRVDMKTFASPASIIFDASSDGFTYAMMRAPYTSFGYRSASHRCLVGRFTYTQQSDQRIRRSRHTHTHAPAQDPEVRTKGHSQYASATVRPCRCATGLNGIADALGYLAAWADATGAPKFPHGCRSSLGLERENVVYHVLLWILALGGVLEYFVVPNSARLTAASADSTRGLNCRQTQRYDFCKPVDLQWRQSLSFSNCGILFVFIIV